MARNESITVKSDLTGRESVYSKSDAPEPVKITMNGQTGTLDLAADEYAALLAFVTTGSPAELFAVLRPILAPEPVSEPVKARGRAASKAKPADGPTGDLAAVKVWLTEHGHGNDAIRAWAVLNGYPEAAPGKAGRLGRAPQIAYAEAHGYVAPEPGPAPESPAPAPEDGTPEPAATEPAESATEPEPAAPAKPARGRAKPAAA